MLGESTLPHEVLSSGGMKHPLQMEVAMKILPEDSVVLPEKEYPQDIIMDQMPNCITTSPDLSPDCESIDFTSMRDDSNVNWSYPYNMGHFPTRSDCSISDDESLIEIALPKGRYIESEDSEGVFGWGPPEFSLESILRKHGLMELLSEINDMNEDDNMIEIDISVGSIKCSRLDIEA